MTSACTRRSCGQECRSAWLSTARWTSSGRGCCRRSSRPLGLAIEIARLRVELRRQLEEVRASRARIVSAGYEERRRIERDLHDGAQQRMVSIGLALRHAQHELDSSKHKASRIIDATVDEIDVALEELRELARGVAPVAA